MDHSLQEPPRIEPSRKSANSPVIACDLHKSEDLDACEERFLTAAIAFDVLARGGGRLIVGSLRNPRSRSTRTIGPFSIVPTTRIGVSLRTIAANGCGVAEGLAVCF